MHHTKLLSGQTFEFHNEQQRQEQGIVWGDIILFHFFLCFRLLYDVCRRVRSLLSEKNLSPSHRDYSFSPSTNTQWKELKYKSHERNQLFFCSKRKANFPNKIECAIFIPSYGLPFDFHNEKNGLGMRILKQASVLIGRILMKVRAVKVGLVAQWIMRLTTDQKIPGLTPGQLERFYNA